MPRTLTVLCRVAAAATAGILASCFPWPSSSQAAADVLPTGASDEAVTAARHYLRVLDGVYAASDDAVARARAKALLPADAHYALGLRRALSGSNLAVANASERLSTLTVTSLGVGTFSVTMLVDHSYDLVTADAGVRETTWEEASPTRVTIDAAGAVTAFVQRATTNARPAEPGAVSLAGQANSADDVLASSRPATGDDTRRYPTSESCGASPPDYCYFRADALNYVLAHACGSCHDPNWHYYRNEDCTNFMSAALYLRGNWLQQDYPSNYSTSWWWRSSRDHSRTWTIANRFYWYLAERSRAVHATSLGPAHRRRPAPADWTGDGQMDHTAMVTKKDSTGLYLSYHSNDTRNKPWAAFKYGQPDAKYYGWNLQSVYDNRI